jgi:hypothetical protein
VSELRVEHEDELVDAIVRWRHLSLHLAISLKARPLQDSVEPALCTARWACSNNTSMSGSTWEARGGGVGQG